MPPSPPDSAPPKPAPAPAPALDVTAPAFSRILVVDDEEPMRHMLELLLRREGYEVVTAESGEAAIACLQDSPMCACRAWAGWAWWSGPGPSGRS